VFGALAIYTIENIHEEIAPCGRGSVSGAVLVFIAVGGRHGAAPQTRPLAQGKSIDDLIQALLERLEIRRVHLRGEDGF
jgi:hypothetical protein